LFRLDWNRVHPEPPLPFHPTARSLQVRQRQAAIPLSPDSVPLLLCQRAANVFSFDFLAASSHAVCRKLFSMLWLLQREFALVKWKKMGDHSLNCISCYTFANRIFRYQK
jgi:hypothetical protein